MPPGQPGVKGLASHAGPTAQGAWRSQHTLVHGGSSTCLACIPYGRGPGLRAHTQAPERLRDPRPGKRRTKMQRHGWGRDCGGSRPRSQEPGLLPPQSAQRLQSLPFRNWDDEKLGRSWAGGGSAQSSPWGELSSRHPGPALCPHTGPDPQGLGCEQRSQSSPACPDVST